MRHRLLHAALLDQPDGEARLHAVGVGEEPERAAVAVDGAGVEPGRVPAVRLLRQPDGAHHAVEKFRLRRVALRRAGRAEHAVNAHAVAAPLLAVGGIDRDGRARQALRPGVVAAARREDRLPDQGALLVGIE